jgi:hypothetical protein
LYSYDAASAGQIGEPIEVICSVVFREVNIMNANGERKINNRAAVRRVMKALFPPLRKSLSAIITSP